jgi:hypothetical protein
LSARAARPKGLPLWHGRWEPDDGTCEDFSADGGAAFLGTEHAILCGAMSWVSERNLVAAISNAGGFGVIAAR